MSYYACTLMTFWSLLLVQMSILMRNYFWVIILAWKIWWRECDTWYEKHVNGVFLDQSHYTILRKQITLIASLCYAFWS